MGERCFLVGLIRERSARREKLYSLDELASLVITAGGVVVERIVQVRSAPHPAYYLGRGKIEYVSKVAEELGVETLVFDEELSPAQIRNIEELSGLKVLDRCDVILDIFAKHARTMTARLEVELAQLKFLLPRLVGRRDLSRLGGGIGTRGPGEKKLEVDRRRIKRRIYQLERKLKAVERAHREQRKRRRGIFRVAIVGYTNAGKSSLMNALSKAGVKVEDSLFVTLDAITRRVVLPTGERFTLTDTVGFIRYIPHHLIESFRTTLEEAVEADLRLHVVDVASEGVEDRIAMGEEILKELGAQEKPTVMVFNKSDILVSKALEERLKMQYPDGIFVSAKTLDGIPILLKRIKAEIQRRRGEKFSTVGDAVRFHS